MTEQGRWAALAARIKKLRDKESRADFAAKFRVAPSSLARWEAGHDQPGLFFLVRVASAFKVSLTWLITGENMEFKKNTKKTVIVCINEQQILNIEDDNVQIVMESKCLAQSLEALSKATIYVQSLISGMCSPSKGFD